MNVTRNSHILLKLFKKMKIIDTFPDGNLFLRTLFLRTLFLRTLFLIYYNCNECYSQFPYIVKLIFKKMKIIYTLPDGNLFLRTLFLRTLFLIYYNCFECYSQFPYIFFIDLSIKSILQIYFFSSWNIVPQNRGCVPQNFVPQKSVPQWPKQCLLDIREQNIHIYFKISFQTLWNSVPQTLFKYAFDSISVASILTEMPANDMQSETFSEPISVSSEQKRQLTSNMTHEENHFMENELEGTMVFYCNKPNVIK